MKRLAIAVLMLGLTACAPDRPRGVDPDIAAQVGSTSVRKQPVPPPAVDQALLPSPRMDMPDLGGARLDPHFDLAVSNAPAAQVFNSIVSGTRYSILVHPSVSGLISVNLKDVTIPEALDAIRELYGFDYKIQGTRIFIQSASIQTRVFNVNYLIGQRIGRSDLRITSGSVSDTPSTPGGTPGVAGGAPAPAVLPGAPGTAGLATVTDSARVQTQTRADFWDDLEKTVKTLVGVEPGRSVIVNPQAGVVVVRAMPSELRSVDSYLKAIQASVERQVVLEAKVIEVTLNGQFQTGINWAAFPNGGSIGPVSPGAVLQRRSLDGSPARLGLATTDTTINAAAATSPINSAGLVANPGASLINLNIPGASLFGLAFQTRNFAALLTFLESQGNVQVLSSPRIATINNQKAVLKVGIDQFFVTNISGSSTTTTTTTASGNTVPAFPTITLRPFFSGVALDITPQIDELANIILHIHPAVSDVQTDNRVIDLGQGFGSVSLPLAKSNVSETDSVVKVGDGNIVAIGGLMKVDLEDNRSGLPGTIDTPLAGFFGSTNKTLVKKELVILIKPTVVQSDADWDRELREIRERFEGLGARSDVRRP